MDQIISFFMSFIIPILGFFGISFALPEMTIPEHIDLESATQNAVTEFTNSLIGESESQETNTEGGEGVLPAEERKIEVQ